MNQTRSSALTITILTITSTKPKAWVRPRASNQNIMDMITDIQEKICFKCKYGIYRKSPVSQEYDVITCRRNRSADKCYNGVYGDYEFV